jgi:hypothetical protein
MKKGGNEANNRELSPVKNHNNMLWDNSYQPPNRKSCFIDTARGSRSWMSIRPMFIVTMSNPSTCFANKTQMRKWGGSSQIVRQINGIDWLFDKYSRWTVPRKIYLSHPKHEMRPCSQTIALVGTKWGFGHVLVLSWPLSRQLQTLRRLLGPAT